MWTSKKRARYDRSKLRYPSDVTDEQWSYCTADPARQVRRRQTDGDHAREVVNGLMYILSTGCQ
jgi:transposase